MTTLHDKPYLLALRNERCIITGLGADDSCSVVAHHVGHDRRRDDHAVPMRQDIHLLLHSGGEASFYRNNLPDRVLIAAVQALAREDYMRAKGGG